MDKLKINKYLVVFSIIIVSALAYTFFLKDSQVPPETNIDNLAEKEIIDTSSTVSSDIKTACDNFEAPDQPTNGEGWTTYSRSDLCFSFEYPTDWILREGEMSVGVSEPKEVESNLDTYELFSTRLLDEKTKIYELHLENRIASEWENLGDNTYRLSEEGEGVVIHNYVRYASDGRIYLYNTQIASQQDNEIASKIIDSILVQ